MRRKDRVLVFPAPTLAHVRAVRQAVGGGGRTLVVEPDRVAAKGIAEATRADVEVLSCDLSGSEVLGTFDAMLACPLVALGLPPTFWGRLFSHNLRPGGRFVLDLPGEEMNSHLASCWLESGGSPEVLEGLSGPPMGELMEALESAGLRNLSASAATHLVHLESPFALASLLFRDGAAPDDGELEDLGRRLVARLKTTGDVECIFHRLRACGLH